MKRLNIMAAKAYTTKQGEDKTQWVKIGSAVQTDDGKMFGNIDAIPSGTWWDGSVQYFEQEQQQQGQQQGQQQQPQQQYQQQGQQSNYQQQQQQYGQQ